jgi:hypothetical protein
MEQVRQDEPGGPGSDDADLGSHGPVSPCRARP